MKSDFETRIERLSKGICHRLGINKLYWKRYSDLIEKELIKKELQNLLNDYVSTGEYIDQRLLDEEAKTDK